MVNLSIERDTAHERVYTLKFGSRREKFQWYIRHATVRNAETLESPVRIYILAGSAVLTHEDYQAIVEASCIVEAAAEELKPRYQEIIRGTEYLSVY